MRATEPLTAIVNGRQLILDDPPFVPTSTSPGASELEPVFTYYRASMPGNRRALLEHYRFVDVALKVVGVGSVGTRCFVVVLRGPRRERSAHPPGEGATASVLEP